MNKKIITLHWNEDERISNSIIESFYNIKNFKDNIEKNQIYKKLLLASDEVLKKKINEKVDNKKYIVDCNFSKLMENTKIDKILFYLDDKTSLSLSKDKKIAIQFENINLNDLTVLFSKEGIENQKNINFVSVDNNDNFSIDFVKKESKYIGFFLKFYLSTPLSVFFSFFGILTFLLYFSFNLLVKFSKYLL